MSWRALATGELADRLRTSLAEILMALKAHRPAHEDPWTALLYEYAAMAHHSEEHAATATEIFERAVASLSDLSPSPALFGGFTGVAWLASHVTQTEDGDEDPNEEIDATLHALLTGSRWTNYDLIGGLVGIGVYFLERLKVPGGRAFSSSCLDLIVDRLAELATFSEAGAAWFTPAEQLSGPERSRAPQGFYNLGVAHGVPGVIALLGQICGHGIAGSRARELLDRAVDWLLAQPTSTSGASRFTPWIAEGVAESRHGGSRLAWCYGDLGIAAALLLASRCVGDPRWEREAVEMARAQAQRRDASTMVLDAGLCHGTAGVAHLFNRLYQATGDAILEDAARFWLERTLKIRHPDGIAGYRHLRGGVDGGPPIWENLPGFLTGVAGVGLALLAATSDVEPNWDRVLLVAIPPRAA